MNDSNFILVALIESPLFIQQLKDLLPLSDRDLAMFFDTYGSSEKNWTTVIMFWSCDVCPECAAGYEFNL
jgi:hypothetical protein